MPDEALASETTYYPWVEAKTAESSIVEARPSCARIAASIDAISTVIALRQRWGGRNADRR